MSSVHSLVLTRHPPYPPMGGAALRNWQTVHALGALGPVDVLSIGSGPCEPPPAPVREWRHFELPELQASRSRRDRVLAKAWWIRSLAHPAADALWHPRVARAIEALVSERRPDVVVLEELWLQPYLALLRRHDCRTVFDAHNVEGALREQIAAGSEPGSLRARIRARHLLARVHALERDMVDHTDQTWACSETDARLLRAHGTKGRAVHVVPNTVDVDHYRSVREHSIEPPVGLPEGSELIAFFGAYSYGPNEAAARILVDRILPRVQETRKDAALLLVGRDPTPWMTAQAAERPDLLVTGSVPDVRPYLAAARVAAVPLTTGGGTRLKILEAFAAGLPVVSTAKGVEGIDAVDGVHLHIRELDAGFDEAVAALLSDPGEASAMTRQALALVDERYSWRAATALVHAAL